MVKCEWPAVPRGVRGWWSEGGASGVLPRFFGSLFAPRGERSGAVLGAVLGCERGERGGFLIWFAGCRSS